MNRCVLTMLLVALLVPGCARTRYELPRHRTLLPQRFAHRRYILQDPTPSSPTTLPFQQYTAADFDWTSVQRVLVMPFGNRSRDARIPEQLRTALTDELQQAGRFEVVVAPLDVEATGAKEVFDRGQFDEAEMLHLSRRFQAQGVLYGLVTDYRSYAPPMLGLSLLLISPGEAVVVASVDGLWDLRDRTTVDLAADYYHGTQTFPLSLLGADRVVESPDVFRRFVCRQVAQSLATVAAPTIPPGKHGGELHPPERQLSAAATRNETSDPRPKPDEALPSVTRKTPAATHGQLPPATGPAGSPRLRREAARLPVRYTSTGAPAAGVADTRVTHVYLNPRLTGACNFDSQPGDDGLRLVIEPRNADGHFVARSGAVSIVTSAPTQAGEAAWTARWDLEPSQLASLAQTSDVLGPGFHLKLLWPDEPPRDSALLLVVRYVTEDGRVLETDQKILVDPPRTTALAGTATGTRAAAFQSPPRTPAGPSSNAPPGAPVPETAGETARPPRADLSTPPGLLPCPSPPSVSSDPQTQRAPVSLPATQEIPSPNKQAGAWPAGYSREVSPSTPAPGPSPWDPVHPPLEPLSAHPAQVLPEPKLPATGLLSNPPTPGESGAAEHLVPDSRFPSVAGFPRLDSVLAPAEKPPASFPDSILRAAVRPTGTPVSGNPASAAITEPPQPARVDGPIPLNPIRRSSESPAAVSTPKDRDPALPARERPLGARAGADPPLSMDRATVVPRPPRGPEGPPPEDPAWLRPIRSRKLPPVEPKSDGGSAAKSLRIIRLSGEDPSAQSTRPGEASPQSAQPTKPLEAGTPVRNPSESPNATRPQPAAPVSGDQWELLTPKCPRLDTPEFNTPAQRMLDLGEPGKVSCARGVRLCSPTDCELGTSLCVRG